MLIASKHISTIEFDFKPSIMIGMFCFYDGNFMEKHVACVCVFMYANILLYIIRQNENQSQMQNRNHLFTFTLKGEWSVHICLYLATNK